MPIPSSPIDLHTHTTASDGGLSPAELVSRAAARGVRVLGIADHDTTDGLDEAEQAAGRVGIALVPGIELNTDVTDGEVHVLGYYLDRRLGWLQELLRELRDARYGRAKRMVQKLAELGFPISFERVLEIAGEGSIARPHVARALIEAGHVRSTQEAFDRFLDRNGPAYVERYRLTPEEAVATIAKAGGVPVLAHPASAPDPTGLVERLAGAGLLGLEAYYWGYPPSTVNQLVLLAGKHGLITTGGTDFHGLATGDTLHAPEPGAVVVPQQCYDNLRRLAGGG